MQFCGSIPDLLVSCGGGIAQLEANMSEMKYRFSVKKCYSPIQIRVYSPTVDLISSRQQFLFLL